MIFIKRLYLYLYLAALHRNALPLLSISVLAIVIAMYLLWLPQLTNATAMEAKEIARLQNLNKSKPQEKNLNTALAPEQNFYDTLGDIDFVEEQIKTLHTLAKQSGIVIQQASYTLSQLQDGTISTYVIQVPVKGSYLAIRQFCESFLLAVPFASLDEVNFKRDNIQNTQIETKIKFSLYLATSKSIHLTQQGER